MSGYRTTGLLVQAYVDAFNRDDLEGQLAVLSDDIVHEINEGETEVGIEAFRRFKLHMQDHYREQLTDVHIFSHRYTAACEFICSGEYLKQDGDLPPARGQKYSIRAAFFVDGRKGKITRMTSYYNLKKWIDAVSP